MSAKLVKQIAEYNKRYIEKALNSIGYNVESGKTMPKNIKRSLGVLPRVHLEQILNNLKANHD